MPKLNDGLSQPGIRFEMPVGTAQLWYEFRGPEGAHPVILFNEMTSNHESWQWVEPHLGDNFRRLLVDTPGTGKSALSLPATIDKMAESILALLDELSIEKADIAAAGYSAVIAAVLAARYPDRVSAAMLLTVVAELPPELAGMMVHLADAAESVGLEPLADSMLNGAFPEDFATHSPEIRWAYRALFVARDRDPFVAMQRALIASGDLLVRELPKIRCRVALVGGADDGAFTPRLHRRAGSLLMPPVDPLFVTQAAHFPWVQNAERVAELMIEFFLPRSLDK